MAVAEVPNTVMTVPVVYTVSLNVRSRSEGGGGVVSPANDVVEVVVTVVVAATVVVVVATVELAVELFDEENELAAAASFCVTIGCVTPGAVSVTTGKLLPTETLPPL